MVAGNGIFRREVNCAVDPFKMRIGVKVLATQKNKSNRSVEEENFLKRCQFLRIDETAGKTAIGQSR